MPAIASDLVCPLTRQPLRLVRLEEARAQISAGRPLRARVETSKLAAIGETDIVLLREDGTACYPVVAGVPILLGPEVLGDVANPRPFDLGAPQYAEAYLEMEFYNGIALEEARSLREAGSLLAIEGNEGLQHLERLRLRPPEDRAAFPEPPTVWLQARLDLQTEYDCYRHIGPLRGQRILQLGGSGKTVLG